jgi:hypothetical protein
MIFFLRGCLSSFGAGKSMIVAMTRTSFLLFDYHAPEGE